MPDPFPTALLFDMDGTLTKPLLDFRKIKAEMGIGEQPILEAMAEMTAADRQRVDAVLLRHEEQAARESTLNIGCDELMGWVATSGLPTALITRNSRLSVETVIRRHALKFDVLITRDDGRYKPDPAPLRLACEKLGVELRAAWMIGDGQYDVEAGVAAGCRTVWVSHGRGKPFAVQPWRTVRCLTELTQLLRACHSA